MRSLYILLAVCIPVLSFSQPNAPAPPNLDGVVSESWADVDYVGDSHVGHKLDIYLPNEVKDSYPVIISIYGSAWFSNNGKGGTMQTGLGQSLLNAGFAVVSINHRSSQDAKFPAQIQDVKAAIRFVKGNAEKYSFDTSFVGITGWSSGGHLASLAATTNGIKVHEIGNEKMNLEGSLGDFTSFSSEVNAVVDWFGPTDIMTIGTCGETDFDHYGPNSPGQAILGVPVKENPDKVKMMDPGNFVSAVSPPFLILHGDADPLVPPCQSEYLQSKLESAGVENELIIIPGGQHGPGVMIPENYEKMVSFFLKQL